MGEKLSMTIRDSEVMGNSREKVPAEKEEYRSSRGKMEEITREIRRRTEERKILARDNREKMERIR